MAHVPGVKPPQPLQLGAAVREDWTRGKEGWHDYSVVQHLSEKPDEAQVALFRIALGSEAKKLLRNQPAPTTTDSKGRATSLDTNKVSTLLQMMEKAILGETNDTYELCMFFQRKQKDTESFDQYLTELKEKIKYCDACDCMRDRLLKAQIIVGIPDCTLQEKLLQERKLSFEKCTNMCRAAESASTQARDIASKSEVNKVTYRKPTNYMSGGRQHSASSTAPTTRRQTSRRSCLYCGISHQMSKKLCPAVGKRCSKCGKLDHFASRCDGLKKAVHQISHDEGSASAAIEFHNTQAVNEIGTVNSPSNSVSAATSKSARLRPECGSTARPKHSCWTLEHPAT